MLLVPAGARGPRHAASHPGICTDPARQTHLCQVMELGSWRTHTSIHDQYINTSIDKILQHALYTHMRCALPVLPPTGRGLEEEGGSSYCPLLEYTDSCGSCCSAAVMYPPEPSPWLQHTQTHKMYLVRTGKMALQDLTKPPLSTLQNSE